MNWTCALYPALGLLLAPLLLGIINRVKATFAGRVGQPLLQAYWDLAKLFQKGAVYSRTTSWVFRAGPMISLATGVVALLLLPVAGRPGPLSFQGDIILLAYLLGLGRFFTVLAALDTGSPFEGMGASREVAFSAFAEPALFLGAAALVVLTGSWSLSGIFLAITPALWGSVGHALALVAVGFSIVFLAENARIPVDDPNTHLELTMIHEVMVLDHSGPDFAFITWGAAIKMWVLGGLVVNLLVPVRTDSAWLDLGAFLAGLALFAIGVGVVESTMARLRLLRVHRLLIVAGSLSAVAFIVTLK